MPIQLIEEDAGKIVVVRVSGKLVKADYGQLAIEFERLLKKHGTLRVLFDMSDFRGWELLAAWEDLKFGIHHFADIERLAMVGEKKWQRAMAIFCAPFTGAAVRYFNRSDMAAARAWLGCR